MLACSLTEITDIDCCLLVVNAAGQNVFNENETIAKYEIMDGAPVRGKYRALEFHLYTGTYILPSVL